MGAAGGDAIATKSSYSRPNYGLDGAIAEHLSDAVIGCICNVSIVTGVQGYAHWAIKGSICGGDAVPIVPSVTVSGDGGDGSIRKNAS